MQHGSAVGFRRQVRAYLLMLGLVGVWPLAVWTPGEVRAQPSGEQVLREIEAAFARGAEQGIMRRAADRIEIALFGANMLYSEAQAQLVLRTFFRDFPPRRFVFEEVSRNGPDWFAVGTYWHGDGAEPFRIYVRLQERAGTWALRSIRINQRARR